MKTRILCFMAAVLLLSACTSAPKVSVPEVSAPQYLEETAAVPSSRGTEIPVVLTLPVGGEKFPVVILAHGHGGSKDEAGGFVSLARALAEAGITSLRLDFPGCGESAEDFVETNRVSYMLADIASCKEWLAGQDSVDLGRLGILGYSMGGRLAALTVSQDPDYKAAAFWSPAVSSGLLDLYSFMQQDEAGIQTLYDTARADGQATYTTVFGYDQTLGLGWFDDMNNIIPLEHFSAYTGPILLVTASLDVIIPPAVAAQVVQAAADPAGVRTVLVEGADHGYGIYSNEPNLTAQAVNASVDFFKGNL
jgi:dienelactone hydrolase